MKHTSKNPIQKYGYLTPWSPLSSCPVHPHGLQAPYVVRSKASTPHKIVHAELAAPLMMVKEIMQSMNLINQIWTMPPQRSTRKAFDTSKEVVTTKDAGLSCCSQVVKWLDNNGLNVENFPPFGYFSPPPHTLQFGTHSLHSHQYSLAHSIVTPPQLWLA